MKVCFVNGDFAMGGQQKAILNVADYLKNFFNIYLYSFYPRENYYLLDETNFFVDKSSKDITVISKLKRKVQKMLKGKNYQRNPSIEFKNRVKNLEEFIYKNEIEVVVLSGGLLTSLVDKIKKDCPNLKIICWQHSSAEIYINKYYRDINVEYVKGLKLCDYLVCLTEEDKKIFQQYNKNTINIPNILNLEMQIIKEENREMNVYKDTDKIKKLVFVSRYDIYTKGIDYLAELLSLLPHNIYLDFAGSGNRRQQRQVKKIFESFNVLDRVNLLGAVDSKNIEDIYLNGDILVSTSRWEGFGLTLIEGMFFGLPVISFDTRGALFILNSGEYGVIIKDNDVKVMAKEIEKLVFDPEYMEILRIKSKKRATEFCGENLIEEWVKIILN